MKISLFLLKIARKCSLLKRNQYFLDTLIESKRRYKDSYINFFFPAHRTKFLVAIFGINDYYGITDRFKAISGIYEVAKRNGLAFRIHQNEPFKLKDYLVPNQYDWDAFYPTLKASHIFLAGDEDDLHRRVLERIIRHNKTAILYIHGNSSFGVPYLRNNFRELFIPVEKLHNLIESTSIALGQFISVTFRFVNLLGDSTEDVDGFSPLPKERQEFLMDRCIQKLLLIRSQHHYQLLITTDSSKFLRRVDALNIPDIYHLNGEDTHHHIGYSTVVSELEMFKSFAEFYLIGLAEHAYQIKIGPMYASNFPKHAARIGEVPYDLIESE